MASDARQLPANPLEEYWPEEKMAAVRGVSKRTLRGERQRGDGPAWVKDGRKIHYPIAGYRDYLVVKTRQPVR
jgi:hypothetical protein